MGDKFVLVNVLTALAAVIVGYLIGSIPNGVWIGKIFFHKDIRDYGSHNSGGTNAGRVLGKPIGFLVIILDILKTIGTVYVFWAIMTFTPLNKYYILKDAPKILADLKPIYYWGASFFAAIGHCWPIYLKFKGGKAVSCLMGMAVASSWLGFLMGFFYLGTLKLKKMVSLASIVGSVAETIAAWVIFIICASTKVSIWIFSFTFALKEQALVWGLAYAIYITLMAVLVIVRHAANIQRIKSGTESKITWMK